MFVRNALAVCLLAAPVLCANSELESCQYVLTDAGASGLGSAIGHAGLSDTGFVTGSLAGHGRPAPVGYRWSPARAEAAAVLVPDRETWTGSSAVDVNDSGTFVGCFGEGQGAAFLSRGYRWRDGVTEELVTPLGQRAFPTAINDAGWIVGYAGIQPAGTPGAVIWDPELEASFVADLTLAVDINASGQVVGTRNDTSGTARGFVWERGELIALGSLDPRGLGAVYPKAIDDQGRVVGTSLIRGREHAFLWTRAGGMRELFGPRGAAGESPLDVAALDINAAGWVVGYAPTARGASAVLWAPDGSVRELQPLVPELAGAGPARLRAQRINAAGQIAGLLESEGGVRTVLLTPAPKTASAKPTGAVGLLAH